MWRTSIKWVPVVVLIALAVEATAQVSRQRPSRFDRPGRSGPGNAAAPATQPVQIVRTFAPAAPIANEYAVLLTRSIFSKYPSRPIRASDRGGPTVTPAEAERAQAEARARQQETTLAYRGAMLDGSQWIAFIEDTTAGKMLRKHVGDPLGPGKIAQISYENIVYQKGDATQKVEIGQNLRGITVAASSLAASTAPTTQPGGSASPSPSAASPAPSGESDIERRLRERRQREGG